MRMDSFETGTTKLVVDVPPSSSGKSMAVMRENKILRKTARDLFIFKIKLNEKKRA